MKNYLEYEDIEKINNMTDEEISERLAELDIEVRDSQSIDFVQKATEEKSELLSRKKELAEYRDRVKTTKEFNGGNAPTAQSISRSNREGNKMTNTVENIEERALQSFITKGVANLDETEKRALVMSGSAAALPTDVMDKLITSEKYSDLLNRATIINQSGAGKIYIPIASNTAADWKIEASEVDALDASYSKEPTLTRLELGGWELMRLMRISAASYSMVADNFINHLLQLLSSEVIESLEAAFIKGSGTAQPKGLQNMTWDGTNKVTTASAATPIGPAHIAEAISLLPQKYARQAVVVCNSDMLYNISMFKGTAELAYPMGEAAEKFMGKPIIISEHCDDDEVFVGAPDQIFVRFAQPIQLEMDKSSGFTAGSVDLRCLAVVDAVINSKAWVAVGLGA